jgi:hypothetical protein
MLIFQNFTTVYDATEDRIRLTGVSATGEVSCLWLTQRLLNRVIQRICAALEAGVAPQSGSNQDKGAPAISVKRLEQELVQRRAQMAMRPASAVSPPSGLDAQLVTTVQVKIAKSVIAVRFSNGQGCSLAEVILRITQARQWLAILHSLYRLANWPAEPWPAWFTMAQIEATRPPAASLH